MTVKVHNTLYDLLPKGPHTTIRVIYTVDVNDPVAMKKMVDDELAMVAPLAANWPEFTYVYGGEWHISPAVQYGQWPAYTGEGDRELTDNEKAQLDKHFKIFTAIGTAMRAKYPGVKLVLPWGAPKGAIAYIRSRFPQNLIDNFGIDAPQFELVPELSNVAGSINDLWVVRQEAQKAGWPQLPFRWVEGPFFPTVPGSLTEEEQANYQLRYMLAGLAYGVDQFEAGVVPFGGGNYYGVEHYGGGVFHRVSYLNPDVRTHLLEWPPSAV